MRRPLVIITGAYCSGLVAARFLYPTPREPMAFLVVACVLLVAFMFFFLPRRFPQISGLVPFLPLFPLLALLNYQLTAQGFQGNLAQFAGERVALEGMVVEEPVVYADRILYLLEADTVTIGEGRKESLYPVFGRVRLVAEYTPGEETGSEGDGHFLYGDRLLVHGKLTLPTGPRNPGGFDYNKFLLSQGAGAQLYLLPGQGEVLPPAQAPGLKATLQRGIYQMKSRTLNFFQDNLPRDQAALLGGILFGQRSGMPPKIEENFRASGVSHLLAVSGLHVGLVALLAFNLLGFLKVFREEHRYLFCVPLVLAFAAFTGFRPAVLRALLLFVFLALTGALGRERDLLTGLSLAALITLLISPFSLFSPGFQLSYAGVIFIMYLYKEVAPLFSFFPSKLQDIAAVSLAAQLGVLPLTAYYFNQISLIAVLTNLVLISFVTFLLGGGLLAAVLSPLPFLSVLFLRLLTPLLTFFIIITEAFAALPLASVESHVSSPIVPLIYYSCFVLFLWREKLSIQLMKLKFSKRQLFVAVLFCLFLFIGFGLAGDLFWPRSLEVVYLDVGQGASTFIKSPCGRTFLIDTGGALFPGTRDPGEDVLVPFFQHKRVRHLDVLFISHPHVDHYGGAFALLNHFTPATLAVGALEGDEGYTELLRQARDMGINVVVVSAGDRLLLGQDVEVLAMHPQKQVFEGSSVAENNNSLVLKLTYKQMCFLFTGDIEKEAEALLIRRAVDLESTFLQAPHHGSNSSTGESFLKQVTPDYVVIPVGANPFGHPAPAVLERLSQGGIQVYRTDRHGAVTVITDGVHYRIETMLEDAELAG